MKISGLLLAALLTAGTAGAQDYLNCHFVHGWEQAGDKRQYAAENLYEYKDGGAEGYLQFSFVHMQGVTCASAGNTLDIDVSEMADPDSAYGMFTANLDPSLAVSKIGMGGQVQKQSASFAKGKYYVELVEVAANPDSDNSAMLQAFATKMLEHLEGRETLPEAMGWFPQQNLTSVRLIPESVLGLKQLKRGYVAKYKVGQAFIVEEISAEEAAAVLKKLQDRFDGAVSAQVGDGAFQAKTKYLDSICIFRKGKALAGYANLPEAKDAVEKAALLAVRIP